jgi:hypothetical protein
MAIKALQRLQARGAETAASLTGWQAEFYRTAKVPNPTLKVRSVDNTQQLTLVVKDAFQITPNMSVDLQRNRLYVTITHEAAGKYVVVITKPTI